MQKKQLRTKPTKVLIPGSGALKIGQAGEFDYSGSQALKALKEEGIATVLVNPNIATVQTDEGAADKIYFLPVTPYFIEKIFQKEIERGQPIDGIMFGFGGQTALNCGLELEKQGILKKYNVKVLGTPVKAIEITEDRHLFAETLRKINVKTARSKATYTIEETVEAAKEIGFPVMMRSGFSLGGQGSSIVQDEASCRSLATMVFSSISQILVEECLKGWKEIEYEVVRDASDNCITVCNMENIDPMGIHTGESIVVAPSQTLDDHEYQLLRDVAIKTIRHLGIIGECNIQYALDPKSREYRVIEVNARLSRSSALASKATGYPLAYVAAKIALGYALDQIPNNITKVTTAFFEPAMDYIVCKMPRWDLTKFPEVSPYIGSEMKSVGEVMSVGHSVAEALQKAIRMTEVGALGLDGNRFVFEDLDNELSHPTPLRMFAVAQAFSRGYTLDRVHELTAIDPFFLAEIKRIVTLDKKLTALPSYEAISEDFMLTLKKAGFSDKFMSKRLKVKEKVIREFRYAYGIRPYLSQIDTMAAEYPAETNFLYLTYGRKQSDITPSPTKKLIVLGSGCYRIGSSVEFDWCAVNAVSAARKLGYETIMLNCNPETVSTDYDHSEQLVFDEISLETVLELVRIEKPEGILIAMGGQTPNNLAIKLYHEGVNIIGTSPVSIDNAEDRNKFSALLDKLKIDQPLWAEACSMSNLDATVKTLGGFPILVRPSYVLSGAAMRVAYTLEELKEYLQTAADISDEHPVIMSKFENKSREIEFDAVAKEGKIAYYAISEHVENAGIHSGDATLLIPPQRLTYETMKQVRQIGEQLAKHLNITGPFNIQMLAKHHRVKVIECNLRASRSFPFISKALGINFIQEATRLMLGQPTSGMKPKRFLEMNYVVAKCSQFSFNRLKGADPKLGVEMSSTGEVGCFGRNTEEALLTALLATGFRVPKKGVYIGLEQPLDYKNFVMESQFFVDLGLKLYVNPEFSEKLKEHRIPHEVYDMTRHHADDPSSILEFFRSGAIDLVVSIPGIGRITTPLEGQHVRRLAVDLDIPLLSDLWLAKRVTLAISKCDIDDIPIIPWNEYLQEVREEGSFLLGRPVFSEAKH